MEWCGAQATEPVGGGSVYTLRVPADRAARPLRAGVEAWGLLPGMLKFAVFPHAQPRSPPMIPAQTPALVAPNQFASAG